MTHISFSAVHSFLPAGPVSLYFIYLVAVHCEAEKIHVSQQLVVFSIPCILMLSEGFTIGLQFCEETKSWGAFIFLQKEGVSKVIFNNCESDSSAWPTFLFCCITLLIRAYLTSFFSSFLGSNTFMAQELLLFVVTISLQIAKDRYTHIHEAAVQINTHSRNTAMQKKCSLVFLNWCLPEKAAACRLQSD